MLKCLSDKQKNQVVLQAVHKVLANQYLWSDLLGQKFNALDAVHKFGYSDQAYLCHDFKKYHSMSMLDARKYALQNVGNVQDTYSQL